MGEEPSLSNRIDVEHMGVVTSLAPAMKNDSKRLAISQC